MDAGHYLRLLIHTWWVLLAGTLVAGGLAYGIARHTPPVYEASATVLVDVPTTAIQSRYEDELLAQQLVETYVHVASLPFVLQEAAGRLGLQEPVESLGQRVRVQPAGAGSTLFTITAAGGTPAEAAQLANTVAQVVVEQQDLQLGLPELSNAVSVVQPATPPAAPARPRLLLDTLVGAALGLAVLHGLVLGLNYLRS